MPKFVLTMLALAMLAACNTVSGAGEDIGAAGDAITDEAEDTQSGM